MDAALFGAPPPELHSDVTVYVSFQSAGAVSLQCGTSAFGPVGRLLPVHGCVKARPGSAIRLITAIDGALSGTTQIVEFVSPERAAYMCEKSGFADASLGLPPNGCMYKLSKNELRVVWPNPCTTGDIYMCHELGHINQAVSGWVGANLLLPLHHWGQSPGRTARLQMAHDVGSDKRPADNPVSSGSSQSSNVVTVPGQDAERAAIYVVP